MSQKSLKVFSFLPVRRQSLLKFIKKDLKCLEIPSIPVTFVVNIEKSETSAFEMGDRLALIKDFGDEVVGRFLFDFIEFDITSDIIFFVFNCEAI